MGVYNEIYKAGEYFIFCLKATKREKHQTQNN